MPVDDIIRLVMVLVLVVLPALAATLAITARFAARPIVDAIVRLREASAQPLTAPELQTRLGALEEEVRQLHAGFERLATAVEFDVQLRASEAGITPRLPQA